MRRMNDLENFAYAEICKSLAGIGADIVPDIYVLSFYVEDLDDDPRYPILRVGYNTRARLATCAHIPGNEPKWNFAFWLQNTLVAIGEPGTQGQRLLEDLLTSQDLWYSNEEELANSAGCDAKAEAITGCFVAMCVRTAQELHGTGIIEARFGHPVPVIIHELEYDRQIAVQSAVANPPGVASEFVDWINSMYDDPV
jgi:hypothetical protein